MKPEDRVSLSRGEDDSERQAIEDIRTIGVHLLHIFDGEGEEPDFSYTVGLWHNHGHPEVIIFGLREDLRHAVLNWIHRAVAEGKSFRAGSSSSEVLQGFRSYFEEFPRDQFREYLGWDMWFYGSSEFEAVQMIWPNTSGLFPWDSQADEYLRRVQPIMTKHPLLET